MKKICSNSDVQPHSAQTMHIGIRQKRAPFWGCTKTDYLYTCHMNQQLDDATSRQSYLTFWNLLVYISQQCIHRLLGESFIKVELDLYVVEPLSWLQIFHTDTKFAYILVINIGSPGTRWSFPGGTVANVWQWPISHHLMTSYN